MHASKIKYRDVKPHNILVEDHIVYITDFGSGRDWNLYDTSTTRGPPSGYTAKYQAPEVELFSEPSEEEETSRSKVADVFSLGCTFAEMKIVLIERHSIKDFDQCRQEYCDIDCFDQCIRLDDVDLLMVTWTATGSTVYADFLRDMMAKEAKQRPPSRDLITRLGNGLSGSFGSLVCSHRPSTTDRA
jgi:serine/threonine protein kinase